MGKTLKLTLFVIALHYLCSISAGFIFGPDSDDTGEITPSEAYAVLGEELNFTCKITKEGLNASQIFFELNNTEILSSLTHIINDKELQCTLPVSKQYFKVGYNTLVCVDKQAEDLLDSTVDTVSIKVDNALHNVTDLSCMILKSEKKIHCSWTLGHYYFNEYISVNLFAGINCQGWTKCKSVIGTEEKQYCEFTEDEGLVIHPMAICFKLEVKNTKKNTTKPVYQRYSNADKIVKPMKVENLRRLETRSRSVQLEWQYPGGSASDFYVNLSLSTEGQTQTEEFRGQDTKNLTGLKPFTKYGVSVKLRLIDGVFYSDAVTINFTTETDVPDGMPELPVGSFHVDSHDCKQQPTTNSRNITLYWKPIPEEYRNSPSLNYTVTYAIGKEPLNKKSVTVSDTNLSVKLSLQCGREYVISVRGGNEKGFSNTSDTLIVPSYKGGPDLDDILVQVPDDQSSVNISWKEDRNCTYVVFWCTNSADLQCKNEIQYMAKHEPGTSHVILNLNETSDISSSRFGVSKQRLSYTSGITWEKCRYRQYSAPPTPSDFSLSAGHPDKALMVRWAFPECDLQSGYLQKYRLKVCKVQDGSNTDCQELVFPRPTQAEYTVRDLQPEHKYSLQLQALSPLDRESPYTEIVEGTPTTGELSVEEKIGMGFGISFGVVLIIAGLVFLSKYTYRKFKNAARPYEIAVPDLDRRKSNPTYQSLVPKGYTSGPPETDSEGIPKSPKKTENDSEVSPFTRQMSQDSGTGSLDMPQSQLTPIKECPDPFGKESTDGKSGETNQTFESDLPKGYSKVTLDRGLMCSPNGSLLPQNREIIVGFVTRDPVKINSEDESESNSVQQGRVKVVDGNKEMVTFSRVQDAKDVDLGPKNPDEEERNLDMDVINPNLQHEGSVSGGNVNENCGQTDVDEEINSCDLFGSGTPTSKDQGQGQESIEGQIVGGSETGQGVDETDCSKFCDTSSVLPNSQSYITTSVALQQPTLTKQ